MTKTLTGMIVIATLASAPLAGAQVGDVEFTLSPNINNWWVEVSTTAEPTSVAASVDGGPPIPLTHHWWGGWGISTRVEPGSEVVFTATIDGETVTSRAFTWPDKPPEADGLVPRIDPGAGGSSISRSQGATSTFSQRIDIPPGNVIAALALANSGLVGDLRIGIEDIANIDRRTSSTVFSSSALDLEPDDVLLLAALGRDRGLIEEIIECRQQRVLVTALGLGTERLFRC